ncbi:MAG: tRNA 5-methoxyuridine(34)/uridine 5-oxyacetic acid(34) synthase CmoB [Piscirickettsiaceae bacterium]|nr:tRNA 5-methoxyuridine(34)/uridine 5-oxyacetic acid(34) synthase CmoB [Piscirickettsiaceae bacterium]
MTVYQPLYQRLDEMGLSEWSDKLQQIIAEKLALDGHGKMQNWQMTLEALPDLQSSQINLKDKVEIAFLNELAAVDKDHFIDQLQQFHPWRKGPYRLLGVDINTEWRSDWKWDRVLPHIQPLKGRKVLDVGCGNGYHGWRMLGEGADFVLGIDPTLVFVMQYQLMQRYIASENHYVIPLGIEDLPADLNCFDTVFSMGVLYHRRSPLDHLYELKACLRPGGELVLETLIIEGEEGMSLMPKGRYAKMRNVWFFPTVATMKLWLERCGFKDIKCVDINTTSLDEQRKTDWMIFESLADFLDPEDRSKTIEGYPAPIRATFVASKPK